jgi:hypothetical protein
MIVDRGHDFPEDIQNKLDLYGPQMWLYRDDRSRDTTRALNEYRGEMRGYVTFHVGCAAPRLRVFSYSFKYLTPRVRITPNDLLNTPYEQPATLHFICSPTRAAVILSEVKAVEGWNPITIYEPIPVSEHPHKQRAFVELKTSK